MGHPRVSRLRPLVVPLLLLALCYFAHFSGAGRMGFYEDDHYFAAASMTWTAGDVWAFVRNQIVWFPMPQGRPVGFILGGVLPWVGYHVAGVAGMYAVAFAVVGGNGVLFYTLLRRCLAPPMPFVAAIAFVLFPADTTRPFLCHAHILFPAVTFSLIAAHLWLTGTAEAGSEVRRRPGSDGERSGSSAYLRHRLGAYAFVTLALLTYETAVLPVLFLPLLRRGRWDRRWLFTFAVHLAVIGLLAGGLFAVRKGRGESRAVEAAATPAVIASQVARGTVIGTATAWGQCGRRAKQGMYDVHDRRPWLAALVPLFAVGVWLTVPRSRATLAEQAALAGDVRRAAAYAVSSSVVAYVFCFAPPHFPPIFTEGRLTSTHLAATIPISIAMAVIATVPVLIVSTVGVPRWAPTAVVAIVAGGYFTALVAAARDEQDGYAAVWQARRDFWSTVLDLCPDVGNRTVIVCDGHAEPPAYVMGVTSWSDYLVLSQCYRFPRGHFPRDPMLFVTTADWTAHLRRRGNHVSWPDGPTGLKAGDDVLDDGNVILLHVDGDGRVTRAAGVIEVAGRPFALKPPTDVNRPPYPTRPLYTLLTGR